MLQWTTKISGVYSIENITMWEPIPDDVGNKLSLLISFSTQFITYSTYSGPEQQIGALNRPPSDHLYSNPLGKPQPGPSFAIPTSQTMPHIRLISLKKSTAEAKNRSLKKYIHVWNRKHVLFAASHSLMSSPTGSFTAPIIININTVPVCFKERFTLQIATT